jgi:hypothetical protein
MAVVQGFHNSYNNQPTVLIFYVITAVMMKLTVLWSVTFFSFIYGVLSGWYTYGKVHGVTYRRAVLVMINFNTFDE